MPSNVEIKARVDDLEAIRRRAAALTNHTGEEIRQRDTFFRVGRGRLKLREFGDGHGELIFYERPDQPGPKHSRYSRSPTDDPEGLRVLLAEALGVRGVVEKTRSLLLVGQTRVHLDRVRDLGTFVELEVVLDDGQNVADGERIARELLTKLGVTDEALVSGAYIDLLEAKD